MNTLDFLLKLYFTYTETFLCRGLSFEDISLQLFVIDNGVKDTRESEQFFILTFGNFQSTFSHIDFKIRKYLSDVKSGEFLQWALWNLLGKLPELNNFSWGLKIWVE